MHPKGVVVRREGAGASLLDAADVKALGLDPGTGDAFGAGVAMVLPTELALPEPFTVMGLREAWGALGEAQFMAAGTATQIVEWQATHRFCGRCATPTERVAGERCMKCPSCGLMAYPRIAPAVIVLVRRGEEALLARGARFPLPFYSTLAGFVEVGETLEQTVVREIREEVGIEVKDALYFGSQPWPFPHSLMVGFTAQWAGGDIRCEPKEIADAAWFRRDALPPIPPPVSIARRLIDAWTTG
ncbi:MAG TPA: NAD(+) diphosphatase [Polyangiaceae bacterium]